MSKYIQNKNLRIAAAIEPLETRLVLAADVSAMLAYIPGSYFPGQTVADAFLTELNVGTEPAPASDLTTRLVLSSNQTYGDADDILLAVIERSGSDLGSGAADRRAVALPITTAMPAGRYHLIAKTDSGDQISEANEDNNLWISDAPDLIIARAIVSAAAPDRAASEVGPNTGRFRITRTGPTDQPLLARYTLTGTATGDGPSADYNAMSGELLIPAGATGANLVITPIDDARVEGAERVVLTISADDGYTTGTVATARIDISDNDGAKVRLTASDGAAAEADANTATFTFSRSAPATGDLVVRYTIAGTASSGLDYANLPGQVIIPDGQLSIAVALTPVDDALGERAETVILTLAPDENYLIVASRRTARATITDNEPTVKVLATDANAGETGAGTALFTVSRAVAGAAEVVVNYTVTGTASGSGEDADILPLSGSVTIPSGQLSATILVTPVDDPRAEGNETVILTLTGGASAPYRVDEARFRAVATIRDNEPTVSVSASDATATESNTTTGTFTFSRTGAPTGDLIVEYTVSGNATPGDGGDYVALTGQVTIPSGQINATVLVSPFDDRLGEGGETVSVTLGAGVGYHRNASRQTARITITDNEASVSVAVSDGIAAEAVANDSTGTFTFSRTGSTAGALTVAYAISGTASPETDYTSLGLEGVGSVVIPDGQSSVIVTVTPADDAISESGETVVLTITGNDGYIISTSRRAATITIADDEPVISVQATDAAATETGAGGPEAAGTFTITRSAAGTSDLVVAFTITGTATHPGGDYALIEGSATILAGQTTATVTVSPIDDELGEGDETVVLTLSAAPAYSIQTTPARDRATVTIRDNEPVLSIRASDATASEENETEAVFTFTRVASDTQLALPLTVRYLVDGTADSGDDYDPLEGLVIFEPGAATATVTVYALDDSDGEPGETVVLTLEDGYEYGIDAARSAATISITDNEPSVAIVATDTAAGENNNPGTFTVSRSGSTADDLVVSYTVEGTAGAGSDYAALTGTVTIPAGASNTTISVAPIYDLVAEGNETVIVAITNTPSSGYKLDASAARQRTTVTIVNAPAVDLALNSVGYAARTLSLGATGLMIPVVVGMSNLGPAPVGVFRYEVRLSLNTTWGDADDVVLAGASRSALAGNANTSVTLSVAFDSVRPNLIVGSYYVAARADSAAAITELGRANNTWFSTLPDIQIVA